MALPKDVTYLINSATAPLDTADRQTITMDPRQPFMIGQHISRLKINKHQLLAWINANSRRKPTTVSRFGHNEKAPLPGWVTYLGATETAQGTSLLFDRQFPFPTVLARVGSTAENIHIPHTSSWSTNTITGVRNFGKGNTASLLQYGEKLKIIGGGFMEGRTMNNGQSSLPVWYSFRTGIVDYPLEMTGTKAAEKFTDGDPFQTALLDSWEKVEDEMEAGLLFGAAVDDTSTYANPLHTYTGLISAATFNAYAADGPVNKDTLNEIIREWVRYNKEGGAIVCSSELGSFLMRQVEQKVVYNQDLQKIGLYVKRFQADCWPEPFDLVYCDLLSQHPDLMGTILFLPRTNEEQGIDYRPLIGNDNRDIQYIPDNAAFPRIDKKAGTIMGEVGYEYRSIETFAVATGFQF